MPQLSRAQKWDNCDPDIKLFIEKIVSVFQDCLGDELTGVYLHGSLATGSYYRPKSDIDILTVVKNPLTPEVRKKIALMLVNLSDTRPTSGDIELSVITQHNALYFNHPLAFELHFSCEWRDKIKNEQTNFGEERTDKDLAAHCMVTRARGICLYGKPILDIFGFVPWESFRDAILDDFEWIVSDDHILESPFYGTLNICRTLQLLMEKDSHLILSKQEGAEWALKHLPQQYHPIIQKAFNVYRSSQEVSPGERKTVGIDWDIAELRQLRDFAAKEVGRLV